MSMAEVTMSLEEYLRLVERRDDLADLVRMPSVPSKPKRKGKAPRGMSAAMKKANKRAKKKDGSFRKGWNRSKLMKYAHKIRGKK